MDIFETRRQNLRHLIDNRFGGVIAHLANQIDKQPAYLSRCLTGKAEHRRNIGEKLAREIELKLGLINGALDLPPANVQAIDLDIEPTEKEQGIYPRPASKDDYALIPQYSTKGACGTGFYNDHVEVIGELSFKRSWLNRLGISEYDACVIYASGDSMSPTIYDGDVVLVDQAHQQFKSGEVYAVLMDDEVIIKRITKEFGATLLRSDNTNKAIYPDINVPPGHDLNIIGRVVWRGGGL
ncbi:S24 family peptidase [uncultured Deefgea sp.]|uniref:S24 family peptidase n=1 Tax=uncultured Deefgea sp. TaxID=1304914 RepID=UPI00263A053A|nr:S24 family peptidase [uncultured Deefgea sp.]